MGRPYGTGRATCESCISIDVRRWHREGSLDRDLSFSSSWTRGGKLSASINVRTETDSVVLMYRARTWGDADWISIEQRVPVTWTACHLGGHRPWFVCRGSSSGRYCGRRVAVLYGAGELFACRRCYGLTYASQREALYLRDAGKAQKIRMQLGGSPVMSDAFPAKPKGMHWRTYNRLRQRHDLAEERSMTGLMRFIDSRRQQARGRHRQRECAGMERLSLPCMYQLFIGTT